MLAASTALTQTVALWLGRGVLGLPPRKLARPHSHSVVAPAGRQEEGGSLRDTVEWPGVTWFSFSFLPTWGRRLSWNQNADR